MIPRKFAPLLFSLTLSGLMSLLISCISTLRLGGSAPGFASLWVSAWISAWLVAFPAVLVMAPLTRKAVERLTAD